MMKQETTVTHPRIVVDREKLVGIDSVGVAVGAKPVAVGCKPVPGSCPPPPPPVEPLPELDVLI